MLWASAGVPNPSRAGKFRSHPTPNQRPRMGRWGPARVKSLGTLHVPTPGTRAVNKCHQHLPLSWWEQFILILLITGTYLPFHAPASSGPHLSAIYTPRAVAGREHLIYTAEYQAVCAGGWRCPAHCLSETATLSWDGLRGSKV